MDFEFSPGNISIKIKSTPSIAKAISIIRKYNPISMSVIKSAIESQEYFLEHSVLSSLSSANMKLLSLSSAHNNHHAYQDSFHVPVSNHLSVFLCP